MRLVGEIFLCHRRVSLKPLRGGELGEEGAKPGVEVLPMLTELGCGWQFGYGAIGLHEEWLFEMGIF
jgi:hypothetical protein